MLIPYTKPSRARENIINSFKPGDLVSFFPTKPQWMINPERSLTGVVIDIMPASTEPPLIGPSNLIVEMKDGSRRGVGYSQLPIHAIEKGQLIL